MKLLICDDDERQIEYVKGVCEKFFRKCKESVEIINISKADEFLKYIENDVADIYFLDIELKDGNGIELARKLRERDRTSVVVFITSHTKFMPDAFGVHAFQYLTKPISEPAIEKVLNEIVQYTSMSKTKFYFNFSREIYAVDYEKIICFKSEKRKNIIITEEGEYEYYGNFAELDKKLPQDMFVSVRNNCILNMNAIRNIDGNDVYYEIKGKAGEECVSVSRGCRESFRNRFAGYMKKTR